MPLSSYVLKAAHDLCVTTSLATHLGNLLHRTKDLERQYLVKHFEKSSGLYKHTQKLLIHYAHMATSLLPMGYLILVFWGTTEKNQDISRRDNTLSVSSLCIPRSGIYFQVFLTIPNYGLHFVGSLSISPIT